MSNIVLALLNLFFVLQVSITQSDYNQYGCPTFVFLWKMTTTELIPRATIIATKPLPHGHTQLLLIPAERKL
jgi:hypothetical protein